MHCFRSIIDQYFGGAFDCELKCVEAEDEPPTHSKENFLQLSCFISQEVRYMVAGLRSVSTLIISSKVGFISYMHLRKIC